MVSHVARRRCLSVPAVFLLAACGRESTPSREGQVDGSPVVTRVASVRLVENDTAPLGGYLFPAKRADGTLYVGDMTNARVVQFDGRGRLVRTMGRKGHGPGEFQSPAMTGLIEQTGTLGVFDVSSSRMHLFSADSGSFIRSFVIPGNNIGLNWTVSRDTVLFAMSLSPAMLVRWIIGTDSIATLGDTPQRLLDDPMTTLQHGRAEVARSNLGLVALLQTDPGLHLLDASGHKTGFVTLPWRRRRGEPSDLPARAKAEQARGMAGLAPVGSAVIGLRRLSNGSIVTLMLDVDQIAVPTEERRPHELFGNYRVWASLIRPDLTAACVDAPVPVQTDVVPLPFFSGDTLWVLSTRSDSTGQVQTKVEGFLLGEAGCDWIETGGVGPARP
jgi:hypothetical protein